MDNKDELEYWKNQENSSWSKISRNVKPIHIIFIAGWFLLGQLWVSRGAINNQLYWGANVVILIVAIYIFTRKDSTPKLIPEHICKRIAQEKLEEKRREGIEIPFESKVNVTLVGEIVYETDVLTGTSGIVKREIGFEVIQKSYKKKGVIGIHPYTGAVMGIRMEPLGYTGKETKDRLIVPVQPININQNNSSPESAP